MASGLPDDRCQCAHLGYVLEGKVKFTFADGSEEVYGAGEAYHAPPGHTPTLHAGSQIVEFSPTEPLQKTMQVVSRNNGGRVRLAADSERPLDSGRPLGCRSR